MQRAEVFRLHLRRIRQAVLQRRQNLDPLDRVHAQVRVQRHPQLQHLRWIARLLRHHRQQRLFQRVRRSAIRDGRSWANGRRERSHDGRRRRDEDRSGNRDRDWSRRRTAPEEKRLLLRDERVQGPLSLFLGFEELPVEVRRLLLKLLERGERLVR